MIQKDSPLVTIQCLTYNHEPYIRQCLEGFVMQQTDFCFEVIVHDDASTDGTANIIREYAEMYPNIIKPILERENQWSKKNGSLERIMNEHTHGKYIALCEGDDYWIDPYKLQKQVDIMENDEKVGFVYSAFNTVDVLGKLYVNDVSERNMKKSFSGDIFCELLNNNFPQTLTVCFRKDYWSDYLEQKFAGYDYSLFLFIAGKSLCYYLNEKTGCYRIHSTGIMQSGGVPRLWSNNAFLFAASCYYSGYFWRRSYSTDLRIRFCIIKRLIKIIIRHNYSFKLNQVLLFKILELMLKPVAKLVKKH